MISNAGVDPEFCKLDGILFRSFGSSGWNATAVRVSRVTGLLELNVDDEIVVGMVAKIVGVFSVGSLVLEDDKVLCVVKAAKDVALDEMGEVMVNSTLGTAAIDSEMASGMSYLASTGEITRGLDATGVWGIRSVVATVETDIDSTEVTTLSTGVSTAGDDSSVTVGIAGGGEACGAPAASWILLFSNSPPTFSSGSFTYCCHAESSFSSADGLLLYPITDSTAGGGGGGGEANCSFSIVGPFMLFMKSIV